MRREGGKVRVSKRKREKGLRGKEAQEVGLRRHGVGRKGGRERKRE